MSNTYNWLPGNLNPLIPQGGHRSISREDIDASGRGIYEHKQYAFNKLIETNTIQGVTRWKAQIISEKNPIQEGNLGIFPGTAKKPDVFGYRIRIPEIHQTIPFPCGELDEETKKTYTFMHPEAIIEKDASLFGGASFEIGDIVWVTFGVGATANRFRDPVIQGICQKGVGIEQIGACDASAAISARGAFQANPSGVYTGTGAPGQAVGDYGPPFTSNYYGQLQAQYPNPTNGCLPSALLVRGNSSYIQGSNIFLIDVVDSVNQLAKAYKEHFGYRMKVMDSYRLFTDGREETDFQRSYSQVATKIRKPNFAAEPGYSNHGWGVAMDFDLSPGVEVFANPDASDAEKYASDYYVWLTENGPKYGWHNPAWARQGAGREEPWHWEYINADQLIYPRPTKPA